ncbi:DUF1254 domain-containing protein [Cupriavidus necator]|uniref:DUF1254 domain-containing protein n=1 Tax=Cupriavidus necator TaxID=106590 RepID=UPI003ECF7EBE
MTKRPILGLGFAIVGAWLFLNPVCAQSENSPIEVRAIARDAYIYAFPLIENYNTMYKQLANPSSPEYVGGFGKYRHYSTPYTPDNHDVVTPNNDTPYSWAWLDLRAEPWVVSVPEVPAKRYYVQQWIDLFTYNFAYVGTRATGNGAGNFLIAGPNWKGGVPPGIKQVFHSETDLVLTLTRTALDGPEDMPNVKAIQAGLLLRPLSEFQHASPPPAKPPIVFPPYDVQKARSHDFIVYLNFLLQFTQPPVASEVDLLKRFKMIGIGPGRPFDAAKLPPSMLSAIDEGVKDAQAALAEKSKTTLSSNGLFGTREFLKNDYLTRAIAAEKGLYGNSLEEAWYGGYVGDGRKASKIHFAPGQLPPAKFFWSITLYTLPDRFLYANDQKRYSIGDRTRGLKYDADGGLTLYVGHASPGRDKESNWLPAPEGMYSAVARLYGPSEAAMQGKWLLPPLTPFNPHD